jgi:hypothetical protein
MGRKTVTKSYNIPLAFGFLSLVWLASPPSEHCSHGGDDGNAAHFGVILNLLLTIYNSEKGYCTLLQLPTSCRIAFTPFISKFSRIERAGRSQFKPDKADLNWKDVGLVGEIQSFICQQCQRSCIQVPRDRCCSNAEHSLRWHPVLSNYLVNPSQR